jgi:hypothetical protein
MLPEWRKVGTISEFKTGKTIEKIFRMPTTDQAKPSNYVCFPICGQ